MIAVTGASGHLGSVVARLLLAQPIARNVPSERFDVIIHCAAPDYRDPHDVCQFRWFNEALHSYAVRNDTRVINVGSWWQYAKGNCRTLSYTVVKNEQRHLFPTTVVPYSIYGDEARRGRGFIPQLVQHLNGGPKITGLSGQRRDFIHVSDVAEALRAAITVPPGEYAAATGHCETPRELAARYGVTADDWIEFPDADPRHPLPPVPGWMPRITVDEHIRQALTPSGSVGLPTGA